MQTTTKHSRKTAMSPIDKILVVILLIETIVIDGIIVYRLGEERACVQSVNNFSDPVEYRMI